MAAPALFLDRDGVVNRDLGYVHRIDQFEFVPGIFECARWFQERGYLLFVLTNQAGIARGLYTEEAFLGLDHWMREQFSAQGITISRTYHCPHHPEAPLEQYRRDCPCRKPRPGMLLRAQRDFGADLGRSVLIGNKETDIQAGLAAGVPTNLLLLEAGQPRPAATQASAVLHALSEIPALMDRSPQADAG